MHAFFPFLGADSANSSYSSSFFSCCLVDAASVHVGVVNTFFEQLSRLLSGFALFLFVWVEELDSVHAASVRDDLVNTISEQLSCLVSGFASFLFVGVGGTDSVHSSCCCGVVSTERFLYGAAPGAPSVKNGVAVAAGVG